MTYDSTHDDSAVAHGDPAVATDVAPPDAARCPSCGRFVGPYATCPYCGASQARRLSLRVVRWGAILLATLGLLGLWLYARRMEIPTLLVADAQGSMNMAYVRFAGHVTRKLSYDPESQYLSFWLDDGSGELWVACYRDVTTALLAADRVPALGDHVRVAGTLRIREDIVSLTLNVPEHLELERPAPITMQAGALTLLDEGLRVRVAGAVARVTSPYEGLTLVTLRDASGEVVVAVDETVVALSAHPLPEIVEGQGLEVVGTVTLYRDTPQITPARVADMALSDAPPALDVVNEVADLDDLSQQDAGTWVAVQGRVVAMDGLKGGMKATLDDGAAQILLLLWQDVLDELVDPLALDVGAEVRVQGEVQVYEDALEVVPEAAEDVLITKAAPQIPWLAVEDLCPLDVGRVVRLRGVLGTPEGFSAGVKIPLDDGTGRITVLLWSNIYQALANPPTADMLVELVGVVEVYQNALEIIPRAPSDWRPRQEEMGEW